MMHVLKLTQKTSTLQYKLAFTIKTFSTAANVAIGMKNRQNTPHLLITKYAAQFLISYDSSGKKQARNREKNQKPPVLLRVSK